MSPVEKEVMNWVFDKKELLINFSGLDSLFCGKTFGEWIFLYYEEARNGQK